MKGLFLSFSSMKSWFGGGWGGWKGDELKKHGCEKINQWTEKKKLQKNSPNDGSKMADVLFRTQIKGGRKDIPQITGFKHWTF